MFKENLCLGIKTSGLGHQPSLAIEGFADRSTDKGHLVVAWNGCNLNGLRLEQGLDRLKERVDMCCVCAQETAWVVDDVDIKGWVRVQSKGHHFASLCIPSALHTQIRFLHAVDIAGATLV